MSAKITGTVEFIHKYGSWGFVLRGPYEILRALVDDVGKAETPNTLFMGGYTYELDHSAITSAYFHARLPKAEEITHYEVWAAYPEDNEGSLEKPSSPKIVYRYWLTMQPGEEERVIRDQRAFLDHYYNGRWSEHSGSFRIMNVFMPFQVYPNGKPHSRKDLQQTATSW